MKKIVTREHPDYAEWRLPFRDSCQMKFKGVLACIAGTLLVILALIPVGVGVSVPISSWPILFSAISILITPLALIAGLRRIMVSLNIAREASQTIIQLDSSFLRSKEPLGLLTTAGKIRLNDIQDFAIRESWDILHDGLQCERTVGLGNHLPALVARGDQKLMLVAYGYPLDVIQELGRQLSVRIEKKLVSLNKECKVLESQTDQIPVRLLHRNEPSRPVPSPITKIQKGKQTQFSFRRTFTFFAGFFATIFALSFMGIAATGCVCFVQESVPVEGLLIVLIPLAFIGGGFIWSVNLLWQTVTIVVGPSEFSITEESLLGRYSDTYSINQIRWLGWVDYNDPNGSSSYHGRIVMKIQSGESFSILPQLCLYEQEWLLYHLRFALWNTAEPSPPR